MDQEKIMIYLTLISSLDTIGADVTTYLYSNSKRETYNNE